MDFKELLNIIGLPASIILGILIVYGFLNLLGELIELKGKIVPEFFKIRKFFKRRKEERKKKEEIVQNASTLLPEVKGLLEDVNSHYSKDNIEMRDKWMANVDQAVSFMYARAASYDCSVQELNQVKASLDDLGNRVDMLGGYSCKLIKELYRNRILDFAHEIINAKDRNEPLTISQERFNKIRATYADYEAFLRETNDTNGQVEDAMKTIIKAEQGEIPNIKIKYNED